VNRGGYSDAFSQLTAFDFPSYTATVNFGLPLRNIGARAESKRTELELELSQVQESQTKQSIAIDVRQAIRNIDTLAKQISATRSARVAAEKNVDAERKRFENGMTTNFNVLTIQQELSDARSREIAALVAYNQAVADYHRAVGDLLEARGIVVEEPEHFDMPSSKYENRNWMNYSGWSKEK
jgi:HAE1 family hydrophobic/amphiphilic exporter-1